MSNIIIPFVQFSYQNPLQMVRKSIGESLNVRLRNKTEIEGRLLAYDQHLNMMIENAVIKRDGQTHPKNLMYLRGDTVLLLARRK